MGILFQVGLVCLICLVGEIISEFLPFAFPGSIISMLILLVLMLGKVIKEKQIKDFADFTLKNMAFLFVPVSVGIVEHFDIIKSCFIQYILICIISTIVTFLVTAYTVKGVMYLQEKWRSRQR